MMIGTLTFPALRLAKPIGLLIMPARLGVVALGRTDIYDRPWRLAIGVAILIPHHVPYDPPSVIVTLPALVFAIEALVPLAFPQISFGLARPFVASARLWAIVSIAVGPILFLVGFTGGPTLYIEHRPVRATSLTSLR